MKKILSVFLIFLTVINCLSCSLSQDPNTDASSEIDTTDIIEDLPITENDTENTADDIINSIRKEISAGYSISASKPVSSQYIALKCISFYQSGEEITVDAAMGDLYSYYQQYGGSPSYDTFETNGYPVFEVYQKETTSADTYDILINGKNERLEKRYGKEEMKALDITEHTDNIDKFHHETVKLDLSALKAGDRGEIVFSFGWFYKHDNPYNTDQPDNSWSGMRRSVYFYKGEKGIIFSFNSIDSAEAEYKTHFGV